MHHSDIFDLYYEYVGLNETPSVFHRWSLLSLLGALIGRSVYIPFGHNRIYPNQYILLAGTPGARKGTAIGMSKNLLDSLGYKHTAPNKAVKESFWKWMAERSEYGDIDEVEEEMLDWDCGDPDAITEAYVVHDEFLDFIGIGDDAFITNLANLWDNLPKFNNPKTRGNSVDISKPTVNILSGMTPEGIAETFKSIAIGGGFFSRVLFIHSDPTKIRITWPEPPDERLKAEILGRLRATQGLEGKLIMSEEIKDLLDRMYKSCPRMDDSRFQYYSQRRFTHLLKLLIIITASRGTLEVEPRDCVLANTILYNAELSMSSALGEYGKSKYAEVANNIITALNAPGVGALTMKQIWKYVSRDLTKFIDLRDILDGLIVAEKIQKVQDGKKGVVFISHNAVNSRWPEGLVDFSLLRSDEHKKPSDEEIEV